MATDRVPGNQEKKNFRHLTDMLKKDGLNPDEMFADNRGIRSCTPPLDPDDKTGRFVTGQLKRAKTPKK